MLFALHSSQDVGQAGFVAESARIVFVAKKFGFDKKIDKLSAVTPYSDGIDLQFGDKTFALFVPDGTVPKQAIDLLV